jgi:hypothetical protein
VLTTIQGTALKTLIFNNGEGVNFERLPEIIALLQCPQDPHSSLSLGPSSPAWLSRLFLRSSSISSFTIADMMTIPLLSNLQVLYLGISGDVQGISFDRLLHAWEGEVCENGAFGRVESLFFEDWAWTRQGKYGTMYLAKLDRWPLLTELVVVTGRKEAWKLPTTMMVEKGTGGDETHKWRSNKA